MPDNFFKYKPVRFYLAAILITWAAWFGAAYFSYQPGSAAKGWLSGLELAGLFGPAGAALWLIFSSKNADLKRDFFQRLFDPRLIRLWTLPVIFLIMPFAVVISVFLSHVFFGEPLSQLRIAATVHETSGLVPLPVMFFGAALMEELGWKGYGMDSLRGERTFLKAMFIFAGLWAVWHVPLLFINHYYHNQLLKTNPWFAVNFFLSIFPAAFIVNWLWFKNRGSILIAVLFHAVINCQGIIQMGQIAKCIETAVLIVLAALIVILDRKIFFGAFSVSMGYFGGKPARQGQKNNGVRDIRF